MHRSGTQGPRDPLLEAATEAADGRGSGARGDMDASQRRILANLGRLAALKSAFSRAASDVAERLQDWAEDTPAQWGHLCITGEIGRGAFGVVYSAFDPVLQREVALKLRREDRGDAVAGNWIEEARRLARVRHPNVLAVHGADVNAGRVGLWADLLEGRPLDVELAGGPLPRLRALEIAAQLASALEAIHAAGLVHGDVKAANVMLEPGRAVLMDFGAGSLVGAQPRYGSPGFTAPELLDGARAGPASDMYSFGVLLYRALVGHMPDADDARNGWRALRRRAGRPLAALVGQLLSPDPAQRPDARATVARLAAIEALPRRRRRALALAAIIASLAAGLAVALVGLHQARVAQAQTAVERERAEAVNRFLVELLAAPQATRSGEQVRVVQVLQQAVDRLGADPEALPSAGRADLWQALGRSFDAIGRDGDAVAALTHALELRRSLHGSEDSRTLDSERLLLEAQAADGDAQAVLDGLLALHQRAVAATDPLHPLPALLAARIARRFSDLGDQAKANEWLLPVHERRERIRWAHPLDRAVVELEWLFLLQRSGDVDALLDSAGAVRALVEQHAGPRHASALQARNAQIAALLQRGRLKEAEQEARAMFALSSEWLGEDHPYTLAALGSWASAVSEQGRKAEAIALHERSLDIARRRLGPEDPKTLRSLLNLANAVRDADPDRAEALYGEVIAALPERNDMALLARSNLAELQVQTGDYAKAQRTATDALRLLEASLGPDHLFTAHARSMLGAAERGLGRTATALALLEQGSAGLARHLGDSHLVVLDARYQLALALLDAGESARAAELLEAVLAGQRAQLGEAHAKVVATAAALARSGPARAADAVAR